MGHMAVDAIVHFQKTGKDFDVLWPQIKTVITSAVKTRLKKHLVTGPGGAAVETSVDDCTQGVAWNLLRIGAGELKGGFDPNKCEDPVSGLKGWLYKVSMNAVRSYCRKNRESRSKVKVWSLHTLEMNDGAADRSEALKAPVKYDPDAFELTDIVRECVESLSDYDRTLYRLVVVANRSQREIAGELGTSAPTVCRHINKMMDRLTKALAARGIDETY